MPSTQLNGFAVVGASLVCDPGRASPCHARPRHIITARPFSPSDMRTWSFRLAILDGALFAVIIALLSAWMADVQFSAGIAGGLAAVVAMAYALVGGPGSATI